MLTVENLHLALGKHAILHDLSFRVPTGGLLVIIGQNGCGKSTLLRCLSGWNPPTQGSVTIAEHHVHKLSSKQRAAWLSSLPQRPTLSESIPILDIVAAARYRFSESPAKSRKRAEQLLQENNLEHLQHRDWSSLSGGEAQRVSLTCMRAQEAKVWLLDEPANHLDPAVQREMYLALMNEWQEGRTLIVVTHNINLILGSIPPNLYNTVNVLGLQNGKKSFELSLADPDLINQVGQLYGLVSQRLTVFDKDYFVFGAPT